MDSTEEKKETTNIDEKIGGQENKNDEKKDEKTGAGVFAEWTLTDFSWKYVWILLNVAIIIFVVFKIANFYVNENNKDASKTKKEKTKIRSTKENSPYIIGNAVNSKAYYNDVLDSLNLYDKLQVIKNSVKMPVIEGTYNNDSIFCIVPVIEMEGDILIITFKNNSDREKVYNLRILKDEDDKLIIENFSLKNIKRDSTKLLINYFYNKTNKNEKKEFTIPADAL